MESKRELWVRVSYWILFVIAPTVCVFFLLGASIKNGGVCLGIFAVLVLIGEHGWRHWAKLFVLAGLLTCSFLSGCAHSGKDDGTMTMAPGSFTSGGITYYPAHPGTTNYETVDYTTNPPPAGVSPFVIVVTTNAHFRVNVIDGQ